MAKGQGKHFRNRWAINPDTCVHMFQKFGFCKDCGTELCHHRRGDLTACMQTKDHSGLHCNNSAPSGKWGDDEGMFIACQQDWEKLVTNLGNATWAQHAFDSPSGVVRSVMQRDRPRP